jgi:hypothetical protein
MGEGVWAHALGDTKLKSAIAESAQRRKKGLALTGVFRAWPTGGLA